MPRRLPRFPPVSMKTPIAHLSPSSRHRLRIRNPSPLTQIPTQYLPNDHLVQLHPMDSLNSMPITPASLHITPVEAIILIGALGIMVALLAWLGWIIFTFVFQFIRDKIDDFNVRKRIRSNARRREHEIEDLPKMALTAGIKVAKGVGTVAKGFFDALTRNEDWRNREGGQRRGLLNDGVNEEGGEGKPRRYGYYEGTVYQERERYGAGDGTSESTGSGKTTVVHRDDCGGQCSETRKRTVEV